MTDKEKPFRFYSLLPDGRWEFFVDASLLKSFSLCERYMYLHHIQNLRTRGEQEARPFAMAIGSWWSNVMEKFYNRLREGKDIENGDIQNFALEAWAEEDLDSVAKSDPKQMSTFGDLPGAVLMLKEYFDSQYSIDKNIWKVISVEQGFGLKREVLVGETKKVVVYWIGKPDLGVIEQGRLIPVDHKTVTRIDAKTIGRYKPSTQMPGYCFAFEVIARGLGINTRVNRCVVNICSRSRPTENPRKGNSPRPRFIRAYPNFTPEEISEWRHDVINKCERIAHNLEHGEASWAWSETSCHMMYMRECPFLRLDAVTPSARETVLKGFYETGTPWQPYRVQED
jgi:PD-(D/E)XK nuclease superfamily